MRTLRLGFTGTRHGMDEFQKESIALLFTQLLDLCKALGIKVDSA